MLNSAAMSYLVATVLLNNEKNKGTQHLATFNVDTLLEIIPIVKEHLGTELSKET